jgi:phosphate butyryltransferase
MFKNFNDVINQCKSRGVFKIAVAVAEDLEILKALEITEKMGLTESVLVGNEDKITSFLKEVELNKATIVGANTEEESVKKAVETVRDGKADILMKGLVNTSIFMKGVLDKEEGLRSTGLISHMACYEIPNHHKLIFCSDSGINVAPTQDQKRDILMNALKAISAMGYDNPKVAALAANEIVNPKISSTVDAKAMVVLNDAGYFPNCIIEGPIAMDVALDLEAAKHKGIDSEISGDVDLFLSPNIEVGNVLGKSWLYFNKAKWAGLVLGAKKPIILGSRSDTSEIKINSIALACLASRN